MSESPVGLGFVLLERPIDLDASRLVSAARELGLELTVEPRNEKGDHKEGSACFRTAGGQIALVTVINGAHPDAPGMPTGLLSPSADEIAAAKAHAVVTLMGVRTGLEGALETARLVAATCAATPSVAAMLSHGVTFHRAAAFQRAAAPDGDLVYLLVDVTVARESADRISLLTHGLARDLHHNNDGVGGKAPAARVEGWPIPPSPPRWPRPARCSPREIPPRSSPRTRI